MFDVYCTCLPEIIISQRSQLIALARYQPNPNLKMEPMSTQGSNAVCLCFERQLIVRYIQQLASNANPPCL